MSADNSGLQPCLSVVMPVYNEENTVAEIVARVLAEEINADIVRHINKFGGRASGLHHKTPLQCLYGRRLALPDGHGGSIDMGLVGEVTDVETPPIENHCLAGVVPVLPSLAEVNPETAQRDARLPGCLPVGRRVAEERYAAAAVA